MKSPDQSSNFSFLAEHDPIFVELAQAAEREAITLDRRAV